MTRKTVKTQPSAPQLTQHGEQVLTLLRRARQPMTAYAILDKLRDSGIKAPTTVYRALTALTQRGLIHRIESLNAFIACQHHDCDDNHIHGGQFAICSSCGAVTELDITPAVAALTKSGKKFLAVIHHSMIELTGLCQNCVKR